MASIFYLRFQDSSSFLALYILQTSISHTMPQQCVTSSVRVVMSTGRTVVRPISGTIWHLRDICTNPTPLSQCNCQRFGGGDLGREDRKGKQAVKYSAQTRCQRTFRTFLQRHMEGSSLFPSCSTWYREQEPSALPFNLALTLTDCLKGSHINNTYQTLFQNDLKDKRSLNHRFFFFPNSYNSRGLGNPKSSASNLT